MDIDRKKLFKTLAYLIFFIFLLHFVATKLYWYSLFGWLDMPMHFLGGFWLGLVFIWFFSRNFQLFGELKVKDWDVLKILLCVLVVGIGWEVFEFLVNDILAENPIDYLDTGSDIFFDLLGGLCAILYVWRKKLQK